jgi:hypothetical protein
MEMEHVYSKDEAQRIVDAFPADKLAALITLATNAQQNSASIRSHMPIVLPDGWVYQIFGNCVIAAYQDGDQERKAFFVPRIWIDFKYVDRIEANKSVEERLALGYCSCGKRMPFAQALLWATDMVEHKGFWSLPSKAIGYTVGFFLGIYLNFSGKQQMSLQFNRHYTCL